MRSATAGHAARLRPRLKVWIECDTGEGAFGDGRWRLLEAVAREGSLKAATDALGISYRKAWGDLRKVEACLGIPLIEKHRGGADGGETLLTDAGRQWLAAYKRFRRNVEKAVAKEFKAQILGGRK